MPTYTQMILQDLRAAGWEAPAPQARGACFLARATKAGHVAKPSARNVVKNSCERALSMVKRVRLMRLSRLMPIAIATPTVCVRRRSAASAIASARADCAPPPRHQASAATSKSLTRALSCTRTSFSSCVVVQRSLALAARCDDGARDDDEYDDDDARDRSPIASLASSSLLVPSSKICVVADAAVADAGDARACGPPLPVAAASDASSVATSANNRARRASRSWAEGEPALAACEIVAGDAPAAGAAPGAARPATVVVAVDTDVANGDGLTGGAANGSAAGATAGSVSTTADSVGTTADFGVEKLDARWRAGPTADVLRVRGGIAQRKTAI